ncbi:MAG: hypothetical protein EAZ60_24255 [Oscillatoriales cyanobacterium]|nr:MAG: hypothetical protein EAZ83_21125 [Oscillatoriales cyanobacterium]TAF17091.1 MAG: hypothetical protein EAZ73_22615 [Oscillatoriales cyanobacterium]TAF34812.1 MAG: hypothetical protein EAZ69_14195 [Oscillatoriales cyanobacterium]TAF52143.1 MAG: hypothetical protein EAZ60_24255 [Oscillatoriales cyanobacterium]
MNFCSHSPKERIGVGGGGAGGLRCGKICCHRLRIVCQIFRIIGWVGDVLLVIVADFWVWWRLILGETGFFCESVGDVEVLW